MKPIEKESTVGNRNPVTDDKFGRPSTGLDPMVPGTKDWDVSHEYETIEKNEIIGIETNSVKW